MEMGAVDPYGGDFKVSVLDPIASWRPTLWCLTLKNIFLTPYIMYRVVQKIGAAKSHGFLLSVAGFVLWGSWIALLIVNILVDGAWAAAWVSFLGFAGCLAAVRGMVREYLGIHGSKVEDFLVALLLYPCVGTQLQTVVEKGGQSTMVPLPYRTKDGNK